ncbi:DUF2895 family protein [Pasteurella atlantica]|uniref:DUF2895 family protein n=2 Tax=Pasteurellaceae TaxID=712 RepID=A0ACC6HKW5_9PAST|nr:DUF2895 family protein [Pasteurella atlantica]MDP8051511.1 DUF2895 family protein [Pasteurella atlantica]MDP8104910.1 DUF2895 family protein [Pasteurella atlantica]MDP8148284.1 DUF2895 family protein [Pasteurella atlantica]
MSIPKNKVQRYEQEVRYHRRTTVIFFILLLILSIGLWNIPRTIKIHTAPDVTKSFVQLNGEIPPHAVYGFARVLWESLNYCEEDCGKEFLPTLEKYKSYITKSCQHDLKRHFENSSNLYRFRSRLLLPTEDSLFSQDKIQQASSNTWYVKLKYNLKDDVNSVATRDNIMLYPIKVVRSDKPLSVNPLGMEIDCYFGNGPVVVKRKDIKQKRDIQ